MMKRVVLSVLAMVLALLIAASCKKEKTEETETHRYAAAMVKDEQFYVATFSDLKEGVEVKSADAVVRSTLCRGAWAAMAASRSSINIKWTRVAIWRRVLRC